jgi:hypothetical protein
MTVFGSKNVHMEKVDKALKTALTSCNLPALLKKFEVLTNLLYFTPIH